MKVDSKLNILLDIEALLDTRYGRLIELDPVMEREILFKHHEYYGRDHDNFWLLFPQIEKEQYQNKEVTLDTIKLSRRTNICNALDSVIRSAIGHKDGDVETTIYFNTRDYALTEREVEAFLILISSRFEHTVKVKHVAKRLEELEPDYLNQEIDLVILYDFNQWSELNKDKVNGKNLERVGFYIPTLFIDKQQADRNFFADLKSSEIEGDPIEIISEYVWDTYHISIYPISNRYFSPLTLT